MADPFSLLEKEKQEEIALYRSLADIYPDLVGMVDLENHLIKINDNVLKAMGVVNEEEIIGAQGLADISVHACRQTSLLVSLHGGGGHGGGGMHGGPGHGGGGAAAISEPFKLSFEIRLAARPVAAK